MKAASRSASIGDANVATLAHYSVIPQLRHSHSNRCHPFSSGSLRALMLVFGAAVVINRNPVASALSLVVSFLGLAALFMSLDAFFIGIIQVLVYAGAVMVLFLFIIMLLDLRAEERRKINWSPSPAASLVALVAFRADLSASSDSLRAAQQPFPPLAASPKSTMSATSACSFSATTICPFRSSACLSSSRRSA